MTQNTLRVCDPTFPSMSTNNSEHSLCAKAAGLTPPHVINLSCSVWPVCKLVLPYVIQSPAQV